MFDDGFMDGHSLIHRLDARFKIVAATLFSVVIALSSRWDALIPGIFFAICLIFMARLSLKKVFYRLLVVNGLILFLWLFLPFSLDGTALFTFGPLTATREGVLYASLITVRSNIILLALICLVSTSSVFTLGRAMKQLMIPDKMIQLFFFTYRYIHVIHLEYQRLVNALKIRGFQPKTDLHTYRTYAYLVGMLLIKSYDRSENVRKAMLCRGFSGRFYDLSNFSIKSSDIVIFGAMLLVIGAIALLQWTTILY